MKSLTVEIKGVSPLLMHASRGEQPEGFKNMSPEDQAEFAAYRNPRTKELFIPVDNLSRALISGASYSRGRGRASLQKEVAAGVFLSPVEIGLGTKKYDVDRRGAVIPATRGRYMACRPRIDDWEASFKVEFDETLLTENQLLKILADTGARVGLMDYRPEKRGPYGRFEVTRVR